MLWICVLIGTVWQIESAEPKEGLVPQPQKMLINSAQKAIVSPATKRVTSLGIARINLQTLKPTNPSSRKRKLKPGKPPSWKMKRLLMKKLTMEAQKPTPGSAMDKFSQLRRRKISSAWHGKLKLECWLVPRRILKYGNPVGLGAPSQIRIKDCIR